MEGAATYSQTTFNKVEQSIEKFEQQQNQPPANNDAPPPANDNISVNNDAPPVVVDTAPPPEEKKLDVSEFNLSSGDDTLNDTPPVVANQSPVFNFDDELKKVDPKEVAKKLGISDFALEIDQHIKSGGQAVDYLNARAIDYNKVSDETLLKQDLKHQNPNLDGRQVDLLFNRKYSVPEDASDDDKEIAQIQMQTDAYNIRQAKISEQQKFKISDTPAPQKDEAYEQWKINKQEQAQRDEAVTAYYSNHEATKTLNESKKVTLSLGDGVAPFNFVIDKPEMITKAFTDNGNTWRRLTSTPQGEPDVAKQQLLALIAYNPQKFIQDIFKYGQSHGLKEVVEEGQNAQRPQAKLASIDPNAKPTYGTGKYADKSRQ